MSARVVVTGVAEIDAVFAEIPAAIGRAVQRKALRKIGKSMAKMASAMAPRARTIKGRYVGGRLKKSFTVRSLKRSRTRFGVRIVSRISRADFEARGKTQQGAKARYYGGYVEYGSRHAPAQPYMRPALQRHRATAPQDFADACREGLADPKVQSKINLAKARAGIRARRS